LTNDQLGEIWTQLAYIYGHTFTKAYGAIPNPAWSNELRKLTHAQIVNAIDKCVDSGKPWVSLPEFVAWAKDISESHRENAAMYRDDRLRITDNAHLLSNDNRDAKRKKARYELAKLRAKL